MNHQVWRRRQRRKEKTEPVESLSQTKDQFEGDLSQLSERSASSPTTQTLSSSPVLKGGCFKPFQQLAQEHGFTENLIHTFLTSEYPTCIVR